MLSSVCFHFQVFNYLHLRQGQDRGCLHRHLLHPLQHPEVLRGLVEGRVRTRSGLAQRGQPDHRRPTPDRDDRPATGRDVHQHLHHLDVPGLHVRAAVRRTLRPQPPHVPRRQESDQQLWLK